MALFSFSRLIHAVRQDRSVKKLPGFSLFLGAGASMSSGIPLSWELADMAVRELYEAEFGSFSADHDPKMIAETLATWEAKQDWSKSSENRYQSVMKALEITGIRETFLKGKLRNAKPSLGYRRLGHLLKCGVFDTIYTTNFDHLVNLGCKQVVLDEIRSSTQFKKLGTAPDQPRLIRLHGDFTHQNLLNTPGELEAAPKVRFDVSRRLLREQGLIVMGYGGADRKLMADFIYKAVLDGNSLKNGLFWCILRGLPLPALVKTLAEIESPDSQKLKIVEFDGFDEAMDQLANRFNLLDWEGLQEAAWKRESLHRDLLDMLYAPRLTSIPETSKRLCTLLEDASRQMRAAKVAFVGISEARADIFTPLDHPAKLANNNPILLQLDANTPYKVIDGSVLSTDSAIQWHMFSAWRDGQSIGAMLFACQHPLSDADLYLGKSSAQMFSLVYERFFAEQSATANHPIKTA